MVRTSRNGAPSAGGGCSVDALDNLNLDDMFADEGDALFDGLDIDLGNMDDLAAGGAASTTTGADGGGNDLMMNESKAKGGSASSAPQTPVPEEPTPRRRKTKRKIKSPMFFTDDEDYEDQPPPSKKKKRKTTKSATGGSKKKGSSSKASHAKTTAKNAAAVAKASKSESAKPSNKASTAKSSAVAAPKTKAGKNKNSMPPPVARGGGGTTSHVAAAGQFGGRTKRGAGSFSLPMAKNKNKAAQRPSDAAAQQQRAAAAVAAAAAAAASSAQTLAQIQASHPGLKQGPFCGILPSNTLFYPFMPALPAEPSFKQRKIVGQVDRLYSSFMSHVNKFSSSSAPAKTCETPARESEPIFQLMKDAFKDEKAASSAPSDAASVASNSSNTEEARNRAAGEAIGSMREIISKLDKNRLAADMMAVCALLKRQHDFLKQNSVNMEQWCKNHFTEEDYQIVYAPPKPKTKRMAEPTTASIPKTPSVLSSIRRSEVKVKIICASGFKEPNKSKPLVAKLPPPFGVESVAGTSATTTTAKSKSKKRKLPSSVPSTAAAALAAAAAAAAAAAGPNAKAVAAAAPKVLQYSQLRPARRRKNVADLIARAARDLESKYQQRLDEQRQVLDRQQSDVRKFVEDDKKMQIIHTTGMWKWLEKSGYFAPITESDVRWRLDGIISPDAHTAVSMGPSCVVKERQSSSHSEEDEQGSSVSLGGRLQSLLVCEDGDGSDSESGDDSDYFYEYEDDDSVPAAAAATTTTTTTSPLDMKALATEERLFLHLRSAGLIKPSAFPKVFESRSESGDRLSADRAVSASIPGEDTRKDTVGALPLNSNLDQRPERPRESDKQTTGDDELGDIISAMVEDLGNVIEINNKRTAFIESVARLNESDQGRRNEEAALISKCQQLLKKNKETKGKNGKAKVAKNDEFALPW